jgi:hypothetical protein
MDKDQYELYLNTVGMEVAEHLEGIPGVSKVYKNKEDFDAFANFMTDMMSKSEAIEQKKAN